MANGGIAYKYFMLINAYVDQIATVAELRFLIGPRFLSEAAQDEYRTRLPEVCLLIRFIFEHA